MASITEDHLEQQAIEWFTEIGYSHAFGPDLAPDGSQAERADYRQVVLQSRLRSALRRLNPEVPPATIDTAVLQLSNPNVPGLLAANRQMHRWLTQGLPITFMDGNEQRGIRLRVIAFDDPAANDWLVVNQLVVQGPMSGDSENWSGGDTKTGPPRGANQAGRQGPRRDAISGTDGSGDGCADPSGRGGDAAACSSWLGPASHC
jgi:hypothetical protein